VTHLGEVRRDLVGKNGQGMPAAGGTHEVQCEVAHACEVAGTVDRCDDDAQIGGHRGLLREELGSAVLGTFVELVDAEIPG
jgi:hypothetical protein